MRGRWWVGDKPCPSSGRPWGLHLSPEKPHRLRLSPGSCLCKPRRECPVPGKHGPYRPVLWGLCPSREGLQRDTAITSLHCHPPRDTGATPPAPYRCALGRTDGNFIQKLHIIVYISRPECSRVQSKRRGKLPSCRRLGSSVSMPKLLLFISTAGEPWATSTHHGVT